MKVNGQTNFLRLPGLANLELLHASNIDHDYPPHIHEQECIVLVHHGSETTTVRGSTYSAFPGDMFILRTEELHSSRSRDAEYRVFKISGEEFQRIAAELFGQTSLSLSFPEFVIQDPEAFRSLLDVYLKLEQNDSILEQESEFLSAVGMLLARHNKNDSAQRSAGKEDRYVEMVRDYLKAHYAENVSLSQLSSLTNLSRFYMIRVFHNKVGVPPHEFQTQVRIAHARKLIRRGCSISEAALQTGFFDQSHLSRHFKRIVGITPGHYWSLCNFVQDQTR